MTTGTVLSVVHDGVTVTGVVRVDEVDGLRDYTAQVDYATWNALSTDADKIAALVTAWNAVRDPEVIETAAITKVSTWNDDAVTLT